MSGGQSFFGQVTRYTGGGQRQGEDTLTEVFAATLKTVPSAALRLAEVFVQTDASDFSAAFGEHAGQTKEAADFFAAVGSDREVGISTQWAIPTVGIPDLVLSANDGLVTKRVAVEIKVNADLTNNQLERYLKHFNAVVLLAPGEHLRKIGKKLEGSDAKYRDAISFRSWETVGRVLEESRFEDPVQAWIIRQFIAYLEEEDLMAPRALTEKHLEALAWADPARKSLVKLLREVEAAPELKAWFRGENTNIMDQKGVGSCIHWLLPEWRRADFHDGLEPWLQLSVITGDKITECDLETPADELFFTAGLCASDEALRTYFVKTMDAEREGLISFREGREYRLGRIVRAEHLLEGRAKLEEQSAAVTDWVRESFELVAPLQAPK